MGKSKSQKNNTSVQQSHESSLEENLTLKKELQRKERSIQFLKNVQKNAGLAIITTDVDGTITSFNAKAEEMLGYKASELEGLHSPALFHDLDEVRRKSQELTLELGYKVEPGFETFVCKSDAGLQNDGEWTYVSKSGRRFTVFLSITKLLGDQGETVGYLGLAKDISERKTLEKYLSDSREQLKLALEGAELGIWDWYLEDNSVSFDERWASMLGLDHSKIKMELATWESRVHPDDLAACYNDIKSYMDGATEAYENIHRMKHADGHWVYILDKGRFSEWDADGKPTRFTGTHLDISEYMYAKRKIELLYENSPIGYAFCDLEGNLLDVNSQYQQITGYNFDELKTLSYWDITPEKYKDQEDEQIKSLKQSGRYGPYRKEYIHKSGKLIPVELNGFIVRDFDGMEGIWSLVEDITFEVEKDAELEKQKQIAAHSAKLASIGVLAGGVGHEINNPLAIIQGFVKTLRRKVASKEIVDSKEVIHFLDTIDVAAGRISQIVKGLRSFSRTDAADIVEFDLIDAVNESYNLLKEIFKVEGIDFRLENFDLDKQLFVKGSRGRFQQVIMNLLSNSRDAIGKSSEKIISIALDGQGTDVVTLRIEDSGPGIPENIKEKIFDPFFTTKDVNEGAGIGLSLSHSFMQDMGGTIKLGPSRLCGACFELVIPLFNKADLEKTG